MNGEQEKDLVILVADADMESVVTGLVARPRALGIRAGITFDVFRHPRRDPGVFHQAHEFLRNRQNQYRYALVMFDRVGSGQESQPADWLEAEVRHRLDAAGWKGRCAVVVLDPELEVWAFANSPHVVQVIADGDEALYRQILRAQPVSAYGKPACPKEVMEDLLRKKGIPRSSALYKKLAEQVSLSACQDPTFQRFRRIFQGWFEA
jgi:hypothetical protein